MAAQRFHGQLSVADNTTSQLLTGGTPALVTQWDTSYPVRQIRGVTPDTSSTYGLKVAYDGLWVLQTAITVKGGNSTNFTFHFYRTRNGVTTALPIGQASEHTVSANHWVSISQNACVELQKDDEILVYCEGETTVYMTVLDGTFTVWCLGVTEDH